ncbi:MAG: DUF3662 and FHA domain-containing protein [Actinobacteria bacterium]|nr:DUF3662 and FHA domain-containing protein [Actinomycetota bacterium]
MGLLKRFEQSLEKAFEEPFTRIFKGRVHPLEIGRRVLRTMDDERVLGVNETLAPNRFLVRLSPEDFRHLEGFLGTLGKEMEGLVIDYANRRDYHLASRPRLRFARDEALGVGEFRVEACFEEGTTPGEGSAERAPDAALPTGGDRGVLRILSGDRAGTAVHIQGSRVRIGRAEENDVVLPDPRVSRFHAEIEKGPRGFVLRDLGSTNGTMIGGRRIRERLLENGDIISMGGVRMEFILE